MRAVSLSNNRVISLLNGSYVPVFVSNEDYAEHGSATPQEKTELRCIFREGYAAHLSVGTVHAYLLDPAGHLRDSLHTADAAIPEKLIAMLERNALQPPYTDNKASAVASPGNAIGITSNSSTKRAQRVLLRASA